MRKISVSLLIVLFAIQLVKGQKIDTSVRRSPQVLHDMYLQKYKANKTVGWLLLGSGIGMMIGSVAINLSHGILGGGSLLANLNGSPTTTSSNSNNNGSRGVWLAYAGGAATLASIPFFISAGSNKTKAGLALKEEAITIAGRRVDKSGYTAIAFTIQL